MRTKAFISVALLLFVMIGGAIAVYVYDSSNKDTIASGITVGGVDVGGLSADEARAKIGSEVAEQVERPIAVQRGSARFTLSAEDADIHADVGGMVDEALAESRQGNILGRVLRDVRGGDHDAEVPVSVTYSRAATKELVRRVRDKLDRKPQDATLDFPSLEPVKERNGIEVKAGALSRELDAAITTPGGERTVTAPVEVTKAKVTLADISDEYPVVLIADRSSFQLRLYKDLKLAESYTVAFGAQGFDTPAGLYNIQNKAVDPVWTVPNSDWAGDLAGTVVPGGTPENPLKARWMGIYDGAGIHGTDDTGSLGSAASHGCIRMAVPDVINLYDQVPVGAPIYIG